MNKIVKRFLIISGAVLGTAILLAGGYVGYVILSYNRIGDKDLDVDNHSTLEKVDVDTVYNATSYNIGFGAYSQNYTFFLDTGYDDNGKATCGHWSTARSKEEVNFNTSGAIETVKELDSDFVMFQEVDTKSTRSYKINQDKKIQEAFTDYDHVHAVNFHSAFLPYPLYDMHGKVNAGLTTISKYKIQSAHRYQYTIASDLSKLFDLDRCFSASVVEVTNGKKLYVVNSHMSAYDKGGTIRAKQVEELNNFLQARKDAGDYVVIGGDWNHDLLTNNPDYSYNETTNRAFSMTKKTPDWVSYIYDEEGKSPYIDGYKIIASDNTPTCRNNDVEWDPANTFVCCVDGFIVSDNVEVVSHQNIKTKNGNKGIDGFAFADHDPTYLEFKLKA